MPPELVLQCLAQASIDFNRGCRLIERVDQTLVHLLRTSLIDGETKLHKEALNGLQNSMHNVFHLVASTDVDHIDEDLLADPINVLEVLVPLFATLKVLFGLDGVQILADCLVNQCLIPS